LSLDELDSYASDYLAWLRDMAREGVAAWPGVGEVEEQERTLARR